MREIRLSGSEGGGAEMNRLFLPLSGGVNDPSHSRALSPKPPTFGALAKCGLPYQIRIQHQLKMKAARFLG